MINFFAAFNKKTNFYIAALPNSWPSYYILSRRPSGPALFSDTGWWLQSNR